MTAIVAAVEEVSRPVRVARREANAEKRLCPATAAKRPATWSAIVSLRPLVKNYWVRTSPIRQTQPPTARKRQFAALAEGSLLELFCGVASHNPWRALHSSPQPWRKSGTIDSARKPKEAA